MRFLGLELDRRLESLQIKIDASTFLSSDKEALIAHIGAARENLHSDGCKKPIGSLRSEMK